MNSYEKYKKYKQKYLLAKINKSIKGSALSNENVGPEFSTLDEIYFWSRQMEEHCLILYLGLVEPKFIEPKQKHYSKNEKEQNFRHDAKKLCKEWTMFINEYFVNKGIARELDKVFLTEKDLEKIKSMENQIKEKSLELLNITISFKRLLVETLNTNIWSGWIFPSLAEHMYNEANYFQRKLTNFEYGLDEELQFINKHHGEEMAASAQLIDPSEQDLIEEIRKYAKQGLALYEWPSIDKSSYIWSQEESKILNSLNTSDIRTLIDLSIKYSDKLTKFAKATGQKIDNQMFRGIISPLLAHHIYREFVRFTKLLEVLQKNQSKI